MHGRLNPLAAILFVAILAVAGSALGARHPLSQRQSVGADKLQSHLGVADWLQLDQWMRDIVRDEMTPGLTAAAADAERSEREADRIIAYCSYAIVAWAAIATLIFASLGYYGYSRLRDADAALRRIQSAEIDVVEPVKARMEQLAKSIDNAVRDVQAYFDRIDDLERTAVVGEPPEFPPVEYVNRMEEADAVILIAIRIGAVDQTKLAPVFIKLGNYWDFTENYGRAIARYQRAIELDPSAWEAFFGLSRTYCGLASRANINADARRRQLVLADHYCELAEQKASSPDVRLPLHRGWIAYARGDFAGAINRFREALRLDPERKRATVSYNLAATLAKVGRFDEAIAELEPIIARDSNWESAASDPDFADLLKNQEEPGRRFRELLEKGGRAD